MSNVVTSLLRSRNLGIGLTGKALLLLMGDLASDDGSGIWAAKARIARELETTDRTVQRQIDKLIKEGFVAETGRKKHRNGYTFEYQIDVERVAACPESKPEPTTERRVSPQDIDPEAQDMTPDTVSPPTLCHPTPDTVSPQDPTQCHPNPIRTILEPKNPPKSPVAILSEIVRTETAEDFATHRKKLKAPLTDEAARRLVKKLKDHPDPDAVIDLSIENGWRGVFPEKSKGGRHATSRPDPTLDAIDAAARMRRSPEAYRNRG